MIYITTVLFSLASKHSNQVPNSEEEKYLGFSKEFCFVGKKFQSTQETDMEHNRISLYQ